MTRTQARVWHISRRVKKGSHSGDLRSFQGLSRALPDFPEPSGGLRRSWGSLAHRVFPERLAAQR
eukprot:12112568-Alexandrium_andersonii.AAC.1